MITPLLNNLFRLLLKIIKTENIVGPLQQILSHDEQVNIIVLLLASVHSFVNDSEA